MVNNYEEAAALYRDAIEEYSKFKTCTDIMGILYDAIIDAIQKSEFDKSRGLREANDIVFNYLYHKENADV